MASRRDELRAHQFLRQRVVSALVVHETDPEQPPFRRPTFATFWGLALALLGLAVAGVIGLFDHSGRAHLEAGQTVIVERDSGARFVYLDGRLHPVANYASALLALGEHASTQTVDSGDLLGIPRGTPIGIAGAPDELPDAAHLLTRAWSLCSRPSATAAGSQVQVATLLVGSRPSGGTATARRAVLATAAGREYLIWNGYRHEITDRRAVTAGLGLASDPPQPVSAAWADTLPAGPDIAPLPVDAAGAPSHALASGRTARAGQLFVVAVATGVRQFYLARVDALVPLTPFQLAIQLAAPSTTRAYGTAVPRPIPLEPSEVTRADQPGPTANASDPPREVPDIVPAAADAAVCAVFAPGSAVPQLVVGPRLPAGQSELATGGADRNGAPLADFVDVPAGRAALITVVASSTAAAGTLALVTDSGQLNPLATADVPAMLGYQGVAPVRIAASVAARLPKGPALDPAAARSPQ